MGHKLSRRSIPLKRAFVLAIFAFFSGATYAEPPSDLPLSNAELETSLRAGIDRVGEFRYIREQAERLGVRVWMFGGTAAAFGHYVNWDEKHKRGDKRYVEQRFDFDYSNIFRSTQDLDIVLDGPPAAAQELEKLLAQRFPYTAGEKNAWEVRLLKQAMGTKDVILDNPDFLNQHTDSNSTGMIEITKPPPGETLVRDVRDWNARWPNFFEDIRLGKLHYYFSDKHGTTTRAGQGMNPPIFSAIRYLIKAFQYELEIRPEDKEKIREIVRDFDPARLHRGYPYDWIEKNAKKLFQNAVDMEYAWNVLEELGLRDKLIRVHNNPAVADSLAWWMSKEPLRSKKVAEKGLGRTAGSLGITEVAHETSSYLAFESITRSPKGLPNVFISRNDKTAEAAVYGNGFYSRKGRQGARDTGWTIRFKVDPNAREGEDFTLGYNGEYVIWLNKNAIQVIPESLSLGPVEFFEMLGKLDKTDLGVFERLKKRISRNIRTLTHEERMKMAEPLGKAVAAAKGQYYFQQAFELLATSGLSVDEVKALEPHIGEHGPEYFKLVRGALPDVRTADDYLKLTRPTKKFTGGSYDQELVKFVDETLKDFVAKGPSFDQLVALDKNLANAAEQGGLAKVKAEIVKHGLPLVKTAEEFLKLVTVLEGKVDKRYLEAVQQAADSSMEHFLTLGPTVPQLARLSRVLTSDASLALVQKSLPQAKTPHDFVSLFGFTRGRQNNSSYRDILSNTLEANLDAFFAMKPAFEDIKALLVSDSAIHRDELFRKISQRAFEGKHPASYDEAFALMKAMAPRHEAYAMELAEHLRKQVNSTDRYHKLIDALPELRVKVFVLQDLRQAEKLATRPCRSSSDTRRCPPRRPRPISSPS